MFHCQETGLTYITDGYVLYDQLLRVWAFVLNHFWMPNQFQTKLRKTEQIEVNFIEFST
jgi:hypothetical protein